MKIQQRHDCLIFIIGIHILVRHCQPIGACSPNLHIEAGQDGRHFPDDNLKWIFFYENLYILIKISLKFVPRGPFNNIPALV